MTDKAGIQVLVAIGFVIQDPDTIFCLNDEIDSAWNNRGVLV